MVNDNRVGGLSGAESDCAGSAADHAAPGLPLSRRRPAGHHLPGQHRRPTPGRHFQVHVSGRGIQAKVVEHIKPLTPKQVMNLREKVKMLLALPRDATVFKEIQEIRRKIATFNRNANPNLADTVVVEITIVPKAKPGEREIRLSAASGLSNPLVFQVGQTAGILQKGFEKQGGAARGQAPGPTRWSDHSPCGRANHHTAGHRERSDHARRGGSLSLPGCTRANIWSSPPVPGNCFPTWPMPFPVGFRRPWPFTMPRATNWPTTTITGSIPIRCCSARSPRTATTSWKSEMPCTADARISFIASPSANCPL